jgi:cation diffusion facilitator family transporter
MTNAESVSTTVHKTRNSRRQQMCKSMLIGIGLRLITVIFELVGYSCFHSASLMADVFSSLIDIICSGCLILCIYFADKPPDRNHPFGHGRVEPLAGLQLGVLLIIAALVLGFQAIFHKSPMDPPHSYAWSISLGVIIALECGFRYIRKIAIRQKSPILLAEALHYRADMFSSLFAVMALFLATIYPKYGPLFDRLGVVAIAFLMIFMGSKAVWHNLQQLLDHVPETNYFEQVRLAALSVTGVFATEKIKIQIYGPDAHVGIDIEVDPQSSVEEAHKLTQLVRLEIQKSWPSVRDVIVHVEPHYKHLS